MRSDAELVQAVFAGDRGAFADLVRRHERAVRGLAFSVLRDHHAAEDAAQDTFVAAFEKLGDLRDGAAFGTWIRRVARNHALNRLRGRSRRRAVDLPADLSAAGSNGQLDETSQQLLAAVMKLPERESSIVMLRYFGGHSVKAIGEMVGIPVNTVTVRLSRARQRLRRLLGELEP